MRTEERPTTTMGDVHLTIGLSCIDSVVHLFDAEGKPKEGAYGPGDILLVEYRKLLTFFEINDRLGVSYLTSIERFC